LTFHIAQSHFPLVEISFGIGGDRAIMKNKDLISQLPAHLFWDVDMQNMDEQQHRNFIICRVMDRGDRGEAYAVWRHYGKETVKQALLQAPSLQRKTIYFFANQFHLPPEDFRAFRKSRRLATWER
jgi:hypothetical protein